VNYQDKTSSDPTHVTSIPAFTIATAERADLSQRCDVILNLKNLTNHRYDIAANEAVAFVGEPLAAYLTVRYKDQAVRHEPYYDFDLSRFKASATAL
jgi:iron complex outermembrane recepter protein